MVPGSSWIPKSKDAQGPYSQPSVSTGSALKILHLHLAESMDGEPTDTESRQCLFSSGNKQISGQGASLEAPLVKSLPTAQETWVQSLDWDNPLEEEMATHSSILAWRIPWTEQPCSLQSTGLQESDTT